MSSFKLISNWFQPSNDNCNDSDQDDKYGVDDAGSIDEASYSESELREIEESLYCQIHCEPNEFAVDYTGEESIHHEYSIQELIGVADIFNLSEIPPADEFNIIQNSLEVPVVLQIESDIKKVVLNSNKLSKRKLVDLEENGKSDKNGSTVIAELKVKKKKSLLEVDGNMTLTKKKKLSLKVSDLIIEDKNQDTNSTSKIKTKKIKKDKAFSVISLKADKQNIEVSTKDVKCISPIIDKKKKKIIIKSATEVMDLTDSGTASGVQSLPSVTLKTTKLKKSKLHKCDATSVGKASINTKQCIVVSDSSSDESSDDYIIWNEEIGDEGANDIQLNIAGRVEDSIQLFMRERDSSSGSDTEHIHLKEILNTLTACDWTINEKDRYGESIGGSSRYYNSASRLRCHNCNQKGHTMASCPQPRKVITCSLCGRHGHWYYHCSDSLCFRCHMPGHAQRDCLESWSSRTQCKRCQRHGHRRVDCPDRWRQYHLTTSSEGRLVKGSKTAKHSSLRCYNCAHDSHLGYECIKPRLNTRCPSNLPYTSSYDDVNVLMDQSCPPGSKPLKDQSRRRQSVNMTSETDPVHVDAVKKTKKKAVESLVLTTPSGVKKVKKLMDQSVEYSETPKRQSINNMKQSKCNTEPSVVWRQPPHRSPQLNRFVKIVDTQRESNNKHFGDDKSNSSENDDCVVDRSHDSHQPFRKKKKVPTATLR